ncbi:MAG TPA: hypothetical protein VFY91_11165 [Microbacterium sp.]|nr:hypothetical protein [Microbacterium sp.]
MSARRLLCFATFLLVPAPGAVPPVIEEYCAGSYVRITDGADVDGVARSIRNADPGAMCAGMRGASEERFSPSVSARALDGVLAAVGVG